MTTPRQLIDWHTHCYLPEHVGAEAQAAMQARGVMGGEASPEHHERGVAAGGAEKFVVIRMPTRWGRGIPNDFIAEWGDGVRLPPIPPELIDQILHERPLELLGLA